ncbi:energy transducer TonB [Marinobacter zhanjiangensis]|uniref:Transporter TonB n=1 Tax=Marinobacter zhanjiangensis TaxID=578215 RepID=A0ABQ3BA67_9GAMM|nr:energy transducer TonB [Marinobacter zhanjiangensis]GGY85682.1 transporter TonB [Marinobacter zhanjiangensis]
MAAQVTANDRLMFTLFMALALHAVVLLGVTFAPEEPATSASTMEITLSRFDDEQAPDEADFLAASNQQGSGEAEEKLEQTTTEVADVNAREVEQVQPVQPTVTERQPREEREVVQAEAASEEAEVREENPEPPEEDLPVAEKKSLMERSLEIASLEARLDAQQQAYARRPRVTRVTAASTLQSSNAWYVRQWIDKITRVGNSNYPQEARSQGIYGDLRLLVSLRKDGTVKELSILESSGSSVLDDAAIRIIRLAAPFAPFPESMREKTDELEIIRTWSFQRRGLTSG